MHVGLNGISGFQGEETVWKMMMMNVLGTQGQLLQAKTLPKAGDVIRGDRRLSVHAVAELVNFL